MTALHPKPVSASNAVPDEGIDTFDARDLVRNGARARIVLDEEVYWLRITRNGKLILTK